MLRSSGAADSAWRPLGAKASARTGVCGGGAGVAWFQWSPGGGGQGGPDADCCHTIPLQQVACARTSARRAPELPHRPPTPPPAHCVARELCDACAVVQVPQRQCGAAQQEFAAICRQQVGGGSERGGVPSSEALQPAASTGRCSGAGGATLRGCLLRNAAPCTCHITARDSFAAAHCCRQRRRTWRRRCARDRVLAAAEAPLQAATVRVQAADLAVPPAGQQPVLPSKREATDTAEGGRGWRGMRGGGLGAGAGWDGCAAVRSRKQPPRMVAGKRQSPGNPALGWAWPLGASPPLRTRH